MKRTTAAHSSAFNVKRTGLIAAGIAGLTLPPAGLALVGRDLRGYYQFPPPLELPQWLEDPAIPIFSWSAFGLIGVLFVGLCLAWLLGRRPAVKTLTSPARTPLRKFPAWGWAAVSFTLAAWFLAWTRFDWFDPFQTYTFPPLWFGYVVSVNALTWQRSGSCLITAHPRRLALLFLLSAAFWWYFEYLNRFVQNWHYLGVREFGPWGYFIHASIAFSTVLPAVASTRQLLSTFPRLNRWLAHGPPVDPRFHPAAGILMILAALAGFLLVGLYPEFLYPLLWSGPLLIVFGWQSLRQAPDFMPGLRSGDWNGALSWMLAALVCGFFWELWNVFSYAKWIYTVPLVQGFLIFEMPLAGYTGYLPFGLQCGIAATLILKEEDL